MRINKKKIVDSLTRKQRDQLILDWKRTNPKIKKIKRNDKLTQKRLKEVLDYNFVTGDFTWKENKNKKLIGTFAGSIGYDKYCHIKIDKVRYPAHRLVWLWVEGYFPECDIDHINRIRSDNRLENLRHVSRSCNVRNTKLPKTNTSGIKGVTKIGKKWYVSIGHRGQRIKLGSCATLYDAARVRWEAEKIFNYPDCETTSTAYLWLKAYKEKQKDFEKLKKNLKEKIK